jgi:hypothetical protein
VSDAAGIRVCDAEREQAADALREHYAAGRLSTEEFSERLDLAYQANTVQDLEGSRHDLPDLPLSPAARRAELQRRQSELRGQLLQRAGGALSPFVVCTLIWAATGASGGFWPVWTLIFPVVFLSRNIWRLYGPAPELDRVQRQLQHRGRRRRGHHRHPRQLP